MVSGPKCCRILWLAGSVSQANTCIHAIQAGEEPRTRCPALWSQSLCGLAWPYWAKSYQQSSWIPSATIIKQPGLKHKHSRKSSSVFEAIDWLRCSYWLTAVPPSSWVADHLWWLQVTACANVFFNPIHGACVFLQHAQRLNASRSFFLSVAAAGLDP